jgi:serine/threonine protein kinase
MDFELKRVYDLVKEAFRPEDIFGELSTLGETKNREELLETAMEDFSAVADPELYKSSPDDYEAAQEAKEILLRFYEQAKVLLANGFYGTKSQARFRDRGRKIFQQKNRVYYLGGELAAGDLSAVYDGTCFIDGKFAGDVVVKVIQDPQDNDLGQNEIRVLKMLRAGAGNQLKHLPVFLDHFLTKEGQLGIIINLIENAIDFAVIRERNPRGIPDIHAAWMLERILSALGYAHGLGIIHGNLNPDHFLVTEATHNVSIVDWSYAVVDPKNTGDSFKGVTDFFSAPEVLLEDPVERAKRCLPAADLYSAGMAIIHILGGDVETRILPDEVNDLFANFLNHLTLESPWQRAQDAWREHQRLRVLRKKLGWVGFIPFKA